MDKYEKKVVYCFGLHSLMQLLSCGILELGNATLICASDMKNTTLEEVIGEQIVDVPFEVIVQRAADVYWKDSVELKSGGTDVC